jgi:DNA-directed RNA polymerase III subunit RPC2
MNPEDMPTLSRTGMPPDIIFNTHAFPSRMTAGHIIEMFLSALGVAKGEFMDGTPFSASEEWGKDDESNHVVLNSIGKALESYGLRCDGSDLMFNGIDGQPLKAEFVFVGPCYIMKLNHDVQSKVHARARGPRVLSHRQPVEGRANDGGNRHGEMEGHGVVAHGGSEFLYDRHTECSDKRFVPVCTVCGLPGAVGPKKIMVGAFGGGQHSMYAGATYCHHCQQHNTTKMMPTPGGFHLLNHTLAANHVKMKQRMIVVPGSEQEIHDEAYPPL